MAAKAMFRSHMFASRMFADRSFGGITSTITVPPQWMMQTSEPVRTLPRRCPELTRLTNPGSPAFFRDSRTSLTWYRQPSEPVPGFARRCAGLASHRNHLVVSREVLTLDKWMVNTSIPVRVKPNSPAVGFVVRPLESTLFPSKASAWNRPTNQPLFSVNRFISRLGLQTKSPSLDFFADVPKLEGWFLRQTNPVFTLPKRVPGLGQSTLCPDLIAEPTSLDRWFSVTSIPVMPRRFRSGDLWPGQIVPSTDAETSFPDKWLWHQEVPVRPRLRLVGGQSFYAISAADFGETINLDKWWAPPSRPVLTQRPRVPGLGREAYILTTIPENVSLDRWFQVTSRPAFKALRSAPHFPDPFFTADGEAVSPDRWWRQASEPVRKKETRNPSGNVIQITPTSINLTGQWFQQTNQPVFRQLPRLRGPQYSAYDYDPFLQGDQTVSGFFVMPSRPLWAPAPRRPHLALRPESDQPIWIDHGVIATNQFFIQNPDPVRLPLRSAALLDRQINADYGIPLPLEIQLAWQGQCPGPIPGFYNINRLLTNDFLRLADLPDPSFHIQQGWPIRLPASPLSLYTQPTYLSHDDNVFFQIPLFQNQDLQLPLRLNPQGLLEAFTFIVSQDQEDISVDRWGGLTNLPRFDWPSRLHLFMPASSLASFKQAVPIATPGPYILVQQDIYTAGSVVGQSFS